MKPSGPGLLCVGSFLITASIMSPVIVLFRFSACLHSVLEDYIFLQMCLFHLGFQISWHIVPRSDFTILCISFVSVVISPLSFLIVFIGILSLFLLMSLLKGFLILFIFSKNQLLDSLIL